MGRKGSQMARMTEEELAAKSARNRKAKAETWGLPVAITKTPLRISARERLDGAQTVDILCRATKRRIWLPTSARPAK